jgi:hypothetical protein
MEKTMSISREKAIEQLWEAGVLDWKLTPPQKQIKAGILADSNKINVVLCARRLGKTYLMCTLAIEECLRRPNAVVKYAFPRQNMAKRMLVPVMRAVLEDCPAHLKPEYMVAEKCFRFPNGSEIQISGTDNGNIENLRGGDSHLNIVDEAGFCSDLTYGIKSVLGPTTKITGGRTIMVSTPSRSENHEFITDWVLPYMAETRIKVYTIYDNPQFNEAAIREALSEYPDGDKDPMFRREYLCEIIRSNEQMILPSFSTERESVIVSSEYQRPAFFSPYVGMDVGGSDLTAILFGYYDYMNATLVIEDEYICDGSTNTGIVADNVKRIESELWTNPIDQTPISPYLRVSDNNNIIFLNDLQKLYGLTFSKSKKDNREAAIKALDVDISQLKIVIHPRCLHLLYHMKFAEWNSSRTAFKRLKDSPTGKIRGGHADALAALIYLHRSIVKSYNPYPSSYGEMSGPNTFKSLKTPESAKTNLANALNKLFKKK